MGVGAVERLAPPARGVGHAQHAAQQLLHRRGAAQFLQAAQHIGKRAVPALAQRLHGDDVAHRAVARRQGDVIQATLLAGGHDHLMGRQLQFIDQIIAQLFGRHFFARVLGLKEHDGPHIARARRLVLQCLGLQLALGLHRAEYGGGPALGVLGQYDGQLDHVLGRELLRTDVVQHVGLGGNGRGRQLQDERGVEPLQRREALVRLGGVRLVHDEEGLVQRQPVGQAPARLARKACQHAGGVALHILVRHQRVGQLAQAAQRPLVHAPEMRLETF